MTAIGRVLYQTQKMQVFHNVKPLGCEKLAQKEYKRRHDNVARKVHWDFCKKNGLEHTEKWYEHIPEGVVENEEVKVLWDINVQCDNVIEARRPDIIVINKKERKGIITDIAVPADVRVVIPVVIGALGSVTKGSDRWIEKLGIPFNVGVIQKTALLGTARILRKVLEM